MKVSSQLAVWHKSIFGAFNHDPLGFDVFKIQFTCLRFFLNLNWLKEISVEFGNFTFLIIAANVWKRFINACHTEGNNLANVMKLETPA